MNLDSYQNILEEPPSGEWPCQVWFASDAGLQALRRSARQRLVRTARTYSESLETLARNAIGDFVKLRDRLDGDPDQVSFVMTGHQPVIFHSGLTYKYELTEDFARKQKAIGIAIVIDTDEGDAGEFFCPAVEGQTSSRESRSATSDRMQVLTTQRFSFATEAGLYATSCRRSHDEIDQIARVVARHLEECHCHAAATVWPHVAEVYRRLENCSMLQTNLVARSVAGIGKGLMEVRLSEICCLPESLQFFATLLTRPFSYARCCNDVLAKFRAAHGIRNQANPFPDLKVDDLECELPFWLVDLDRGTRSIPVIRRIDGVPTLCSDGGLSVELIPGHEAACLFALCIGRTPLVPRGPLITATMRLLFSDLFVHGTGGGRYDQFTDELIEAWWKETPSPVAVASASRFLFDAERSELLRLESLSDRQRELQFNPQRSLGTGVFSSTLETTLRQLLAEKEGLVTSLQRAKAQGESAESTGRAIQRVTDRIRSLVASEFESQVQAFRSISQAAKETIRSRTWPWFFFPNDC